MAIESIRNFTRESGDLATAGQPDKQQLQAIAEAGFDVVINLGLAEADYAVPEEKTILEAHGVEYHHVPVSFDAPEIEKYNEFAALMKATEHKKTFVHCVANKRVSVFLALYRILEKHAPREGALNEVHKVWVPNNTWQEFMRVILDKKQC
jgi:protein tyrosine phosphatase (PTP) superfamily phosphohydrolase (DUF442 family)